MSPAEKKSPLPPPPLPAVRPAEAAPTPPPGRVLAAVSGGGDSVALVHYLGALASAGGWEVVVGHVDHGLRPDAGRDAEFVAGLARDLGLTFALARVKVLARGRSPEEAAREARRGALRDLAARAGAGVVALGHTADDQAETVLARVLTGAGPTGLAAMRPLEDGWWRPLLHHRRADLRAWLTALGRKWREDPTNLAPDFQRNRLRHRVLPLVEEAVNPQATLALARLAGICAAEEDYWAGWCAEAWQIAGRGEGDSLCLDLRFFRAQHPAAQARLVRHLAQALTGGGQHLLSRQVAQVLELAAGPPGRQLTLPRGLTAHAERDTLRLGPAAPPPPLAAALAGPGEVDLPGLGQTLVVRLASRPPRLAARGPVAWLPAGEVAWPLTVRWPRRGERFHPLGAPGAKRLSRVLIDRGVPPWWRARQVVVEDQRGLWWVGPLSVAERARQGEDALNFVQLALVDTPCQPSYTKVFSPGGEPGHSGHIPLNSDAISE